MALRRSLVPGLLATVVTLAVAVGCSSSSGSTAAMVPVANLEQTTINVAAVPTTDSTGLYVAQYEGLFAKEGLKVNILPAISAEQSINQLAYNQIQVLAGNYVSYVEAQINYNNGVKAPNPQAVKAPTREQISANLDIFAEASIEQPGFVGLYVPATSPIRSVADLKGKTIGINAPFNVAYLLLASWEQANGMAPTAPNLLPTFPFPVMTNMLLQKKVQVAFLAEPFISIAEESAGLREITNLDQGATTGFPIEGYAATKQWAKANPNSLAAFNSALQQGQQIAATDRHIAELATIQYGLLPSMPSGTPMAAAKQIAALLQFETYPLGQVDKTRLQRVANVMKQFNLIGDFNVQQMLNP